MREVYRDESLAYRYQAVHASLQQARNISTAKQFLPMLSNRIRVSIYFSVLACTETDVALVFTIILAAVQHHRVSGLASLSNIKPREILDKTREDVNTLADHAQVL